MPNTAEDNRSYYMRNRERLLAKQNKRWTDMTEEMKEANRIYQREYYRKRHPSKAKAPSPPRSENEPMIKYSDTPIVLLFT